MAIEPEVVDPPGAVQVGDAAGVVDDGAESARASRKRPLRSAVEWVIVVVGALLVATVIKTFLFQAFWIPSGSMLPTLDVNDRVVVNKLSYDLHEVNRGDVVVFERPPGEPTEIKDLIKRVVATEGETLTLRDGEVFIDGEALDEPYVAEGSATVNICSFTGSVTVPADHVFVMGDNRADSKDSRCFGAIDEDLIVGRAFVRVWPLTDLGGL